MYFPITFSDYKRPVGEIHCCRLINDLYFCKQFRSMSLYSVLRYLAGGADLGGNRNQL